MKKFMLFEEFKKKRSKTSSFDSPEYVVEPAKDDKGFFMLKKAFDKRKKKFSTGYFA